MDIQFIRRDSPLSLVLQLRRTKEMREYRRDEGPLTGQRLLHIVFADKLIRKGLLRDEAQIQQPLYDAVTFPNELFVMEGNGEVLKYVGVSWAGHRSAGYPPAGPRSRNRR